MEKHTAYERNRMKREDAQALLDAFRLDREEPPPCDTAKMARRFVRIVGPDRLFCEDRLPRKKGPATRRGQ
jgi:hypothetical protein